MNDDDKWGRDKSPPQPVEGVKKHPLKTPKKHKRRRFLTSFGTTRLECHPEQFLRGISSLNRGGEQTLLELYPKTKTEEMSHFVRHDTIKSLFDGDKAEILRFAQDDQNTVSWEGGFYPFPILENYPLRSG